MIEKDLIAYLSRKLNVDIRAEKPSVVETPCVILEKTGCSCTDHIYTSTVVFQSYSDSMLGAAELDELVREAVEGAIELPSIAGLELVSDFNSTYTEMKLYRYTCAYSITHY